MKNSMRVAFCGVIAALSTVLFLLTGVVPVATIALPAIAGANSIWFAMPLTELLVAVFVVCMLVRYTRQLPTERKIVHE